MLIINKYFTQYQTLFEQSMIVHLLLKDESLILYNTISKQVFFSNYFLLFLILFF